MEYTPEEIERANGISLTEVAHMLGFTVKRIGNYYTTKEIDSLIIFEKRTWNRFSGIKVNGRRGGNVIDFLVAFGNMTFPEAVQWSLDKQGLMSEKDIEFSKSEGKKKAERKEFILPRKNKTQTKMFRYLMCERMLSYDTIMFFVKLGLIYESDKYHNMVSVGRDKNGVPRYAGLRGTYDVSGQKPFKCDVEGNDKNYGVNLHCRGSRTVVVFEGTIDMMSYFEMGRGGESLLSLAAVGEAPLNTFLEEHPEIKKVVLALDNDVAGRKATKKLAKKYRDLKYEVKHYAYPRREKDINEYLQNRKLGLGKHGKRDRIRK